MSNPDATDTIHGAADPSPLQAIARHKKLVLACGAAGAALTYGFLHFVTPRYVSTADIRIDMQAPRVTGENAAMLPDEHPTVEVVNTEMAALASPALATAAARAMKLSDLRAFQICPAETLSDRIAAVLTPHAHHALPPCVRSADHAGRELLGRMSFGTDRGSFIISISATASSPDLAARLANGYATAYVEWQRDKKLQLAQDADSYLTNEIDTLHSQMMRADMAVEAYRQKHHLIGLHSDAAGASPDTLSTGQLSQASQALGDVMGQLADRRSTVAEVRQALKEGRYDSVGPALQSPIVQTLLTRHAEIAGRLAELRTQYGENYPAVAGLVAELARTERQIQIEVARVAASLDSEYAALANRRNSVASRVASLQHEVAGESAADVGLQELQREAATQRSVYESSFVKLKQLDAERFLERANADVVVEALPPNFPDFPRKGMMAMGAFLAFAGLGAGLAFLRDMTSRRFRDATQIEEEIGLPVAGVFARTRTAPAAIPLDYPNTVEAEMIHAALIQVIGNRAGSAQAERGLAVLMTSALPREGKSCFSVALARAAASIGMNVMVLDCDIRRPAVRALVAPAGGAAQPPVRSPADLTTASDTEGTVNLILKEAAVDPRSGVRMLTLSDYVTNPRGLLNWPALPKLVTALQSRFDLVLLDAPPVLAVSDALHLGPLADRALFMIDWEATPREAVQAALRSLGRAGIAMSGAIMTKVDIRRYARSGANTGLYLRQIRPYLGQAA